MKKFLSLFLVAALAMFSIGCEPAGDDVDPVGDPPAVDTDDTGSDTTTGDDTTNDTGADDTANDGG